MKTLVYLSTGTSSTKSIPIQIPARDPIPVVVSQLIHSISVQHFFSSFSLSTTFISCILIHLLQSDAELG